MVVNKGLTSEIFSLGEINKTYDKVANGQVQFRAIIKK
jgi:D-arabinose 1-dehydrogenase-like Zn-dependent alcohol dehydrogenase